MIPNGKLTDLNLEVLKKISEQSSTFYIDKHTTLDSCVLHLSDFMP